MKSEDKAFRVVHVRIISAVYFALLAGIATVLIDSFLTSLGMEEVIPIIQNVPLALGVAAVFGALYGEKIMHAKAPYKLHVFLWGFLMTLSALPIYNAFLIYFVRYDNLPLFANAKFIHYFYLYWASLAYLFIVAGFWIALMAGLAAIFLRSQVVYDIDYSHQLDKKPSPMAGYDVKPKPARRVPHKKIPH